ncbi:MAG: HEAT repeat domain-containing protein [Bradymonadaceae bacterium]
MPPGESNDGVLIAVTWALGQVGDAESVKTLEDALRRSPRDVQFVAARALADIGTDRAVRALVGARWDERTALHGPAMRGLARVATRLEDEGGEDAQIRRRSDALMSDIAHIAERDQKIDVQGLVPEIRRNRCRGRRPATRRVERRRRPRARRSVAIRSAAAGDAGAG